MKFNKMFKNIVIALLLVMLVGLFAGCGSVNSPETQTSQQGTEVSSQKSTQTIIFGATSDFKNASAREGHSLVFDHLTTFKENMEVAPGLVSAWEIKDEGKVYILNLQKGVKFHNGSDFTAEVAKFSITYWAKYEHSNYPKYLSEINILDEATLEVSFNKPYSAFLIELGAIRVTLPESVDDKGNVLEWTGTGPFILKEYEKDQKAVLEVNTSYWNQDKMPKIKEVVWQTIPNENSRIMALKNGQIDVLGVTEHHLSIPYAAVPELEKTPGIKVLKPTRETLNTTDCYVFNYKREPLTDLNLRKAIVYAIDRETLSTKLFHDIPIATGHFLLPEYKDGPKNSKPYTYDLELAKQALDAAGYKDTNGDGIVEKNGKPLKLSLLTQNNQVARDTAVYLQANLKAIGIDLVIESLEKNAYEEKAKAGEFDISNTHAWIVPPVRYMQWRGLSDGYDNFGIGFKVDAKIEELVQTVLTAADEKEREKAWDEIWELQYNFFPGTSLYVRSRVFAFKDNIDGLYFSPRVQNIDLSRVTIK